MFMCMHKYTHIYVYAYIQSHILYMYILYICVYVYILYTHTYTCKQMHTHTYSCIHILSPPPYIYRYSPSMMLIPHTHPSVSGGAGPCAEWRLTVNIAGNNNLRNTVSHASLTAILTGNLTCF